MAIGLVQGWEGACFPRVFYTTTAVSTRCRGATFRQASIRPCPPPSGMISWHSASGQRPYPFAQTLTIRRVQATLSVTPSMLHDRMGKNTVGIPKITNQFPLHCCRAHASLLSPLLQVPAQRHSLEHRHLLNRRHIGLISVTSRLGRRQDLANLTVTVGSN